MTDVMITNLRWTAPELNLTHRSKHPATNEAKMYVTEYFISSACARNGSRQRNMQSYVASLCGLFLFMWQKEMDDKDSPS